MPGSEKRELDFFQQCRDALNEKIEQYQQKLDNATTVDEVEAIRKEAPGIADIPECAQFYPEKNSIK